jgi:hypothetical protein
MIKTSLTICGCAACGELGIGASGSAARADGPTAIRGGGYDLWFIGAQRETIMNGKLAAVLDLGTLASRPHLYGVGPIEQLRGEATIADSRPALARVTPEGTVSVTQSFAVGDRFSSGRRSRAGSSSRFRPKFVHMKILSASFRKPLRPRASMPTSLCRFGSPAGRI